MRGSLTVSANSEGYRANPCAGFGCEQPIRKLEQIELSFGEYAANTAAYVGFVLLLVGALFLFVLLQLHDAKLKAEWAKETPPDSSDDVSVNPEASAKLQELIALQEKALAEAERQQGKYDELPLSAQEKQNIAAERDRALAEAKKHQAEIERLSEH